MKRGAFCIYLIYLTNLIMRHDKVFSIAFQPEQLKNARTTQL